MLANGISFRPLSGNVILNDYGMILKPERNYRFRPLSGNVILNFTGD